MSNQCENCPKPDMIIRNGSCYFCPNNTFYDPSIHSCIGCPQDRFYDVTTKSCKLKCSGGSIYNITSNQCRCPTDRPYSDGTTCFACNAPKHWDDTQKACIGGC